MSEFPDDHEPGGTFLNDLAGIAVYGVIAAILLALVAWMSLVPASGATLVMDPHPTTGVANPAVTQATIGSTICVHGWTKTVRPPASYTNHLKAAQLPPGTDLSRWEEDHVRGIEDGGDPRDPHNLRPQPWDGPDGAHAKDGVETATKRAICSGRMTLEQGQSALAAWVTEHHPYPIVQAGAPQ